jgi:hypothetical protein
MHTTRNTEADVASTAGPYSAEEARSTDNAPPPFVYELDDINIEVDMHRHPNTPDALKRSLAIVFKKGSLAGLRLHGFTVWADPRQGGDEVRYPSKELRTPGNGFKRFWSLLRGSVRNDFTPHQRLNRLILDAVAAASAAEVTTD